MSSDGPRKNRLDSGYGTDIPSPFSANVREKPVFFGEEFTPGETEVNKNSREENRSNRSNSHEVVGPSRSGEDGNSSIEGVEVIEDISNGGAACNSVFKLNGKESVGVINPSNNCGMVHNELGDGDRESLTDTLLTNEFVEECSEERPVVHMASSSSTSCVQIDKIQHSRLTDYDDLGFPLKRTASLPDIKTMRMRATQEVGRRLRRLSDEFYYRTIYARRCKACSAQLRNDHVLSQSNADDNS